MNDRAVSVLENYDIEVNRTSKGRGSIICDTDKGILVLKEYNSNPDKLVLIDNMQKNISEVIKTDTLVRNKDDQLFSKDADGITYILKEAIDGHECNYKNEDDIIQAFKTMAKLHKAMENEQDEEIGKLPFRSYVKEMEKHTRECKRVLNYLGKLKSRTEFEKALYKEYGYFMKKAVEVTEMASEENMEEYEKHICQKGYFYHGDYQYHNVIFSKGNVAVINFERFGKDSGVRDLYLLFRKISEKTDWSVSLGDKMLNAYISCRNLDEYELRQLKYRLAYPDKFWKIVNFYFNSKKTWIPNKNYEKLENLVKQEQAKDICIEKLLAD